ncbi:Uncharacterised protein [Escherichia coli]|nr:Uncharacterised protein [Escherichia coli]
MAVWKQSSNHNKLLSNRSKTKRVQCFIDGYNLYHAIEETGNKLFIGLILIFMQEIPS